MHCNYKWAHNSLFLYLTHLFRLVQRLGHHISSKNSRALTVSGKTRHSHFIRCAPIHSKCVCNFFLWFEKPKETKSWSVPSISRFRKSNNNSIESWLQQKLLTILGYLVVKNYLDLYTFFLSFEQFFLSFEQFFLSFEQFLSLVRASLINCSKLPHCE